MKYLWISLLFIGCGNGEKLNEITSEIGAIPDPTERGLMYIALAIFISAIIKAIFNE